MKNSFFKKKQQQQEYRQNVKELARPNLVPNCLQMLSGDITGRHRVKEYFMQENGFDIPLCTSHHVHDIRVSFLRELTQNTFDSWHQMGCPFSREVTENSLSKTMSRERTEF